MKEPSYEELKEAALEQQEKHPDASAAVFGAKYPGFYEKATRVFREVKGVL